MIIYKISLFYHFGLVIFLHWVMHMSFYGLPLTINEDGASGSSVGKASEPRSRGYVVRNARWAPDGGVGPHPTSPIQQMLRRRRPH